MGTASSALSSAVSSFNGTSEYAGDLQQAINQAVAIASIPLTQLQDNVTTLQSQAGELSTLQNDFGTLQSAIQQLGSSSGTQALTGTVSDSTVASVSVDPSSAIAAGTYTLDVINAGTPASTISSAGLDLVTDPSQTSISSASTFTLSIGDSTYQITPSGNTLNALAEAINSAGLGVTATVVNVGSLSSPDYRLSLQGTSLAAQTIQLNDGTHNLLTVLVNGAPAQYQIDGQSTVSSSSSQITIAPGVTANLLAAGQTTISVASDPSGAADALTSFVSAYNAVVAELNNNHGTAGGALTGQTIVTGLEQSLESLISFTGGSGSVQNLTDLGLTFSQSGQLSFDQATFDNAANSDPQDVANFLGSPTTGGFLQAATNLLNGLEDPNTGLFAETNTSIQNQITSDNQQITNTQNNITTMQNDLTAQMSQADTMIASLESQQTYYTDLFQDQQDDIQNG
jgi:flagellar hook-associated protein 2